MINLEGAKLKRTELDEGRKVGCIQVSTGEKEYFILAKGERLLTEWIVALEKAAQPRPTGNQLIRTTSKTVLPHPHSLVLLPVVRACVHVRFCDTHTYTHTAHTRLTVIAHRTQAADLTSRAEPAAASRRSRPVA
jgi:hypothetical protein